MTKTNLNTTDVLFCYEARKSKTIKLDFGEVDMLPAGTLINHEGKAVNDLTALGILLYDTCRWTRSGQGVVLVSGHVDLKEAQESCGQTYSSEAKAALKNIIFVGDTEVPSGGGTGGGGEYFETVGGDTLTWDGNTEGLPNASGTFFCVSDIVPTIEELSRGGSGNFVGLGILEFTAETVMDMGDVIIASDSNGTPIAMIAKTDNAVFDMGDDGSFAFPVKGIYLASARGIYVSSLTINGYTGFTTTKLKEEYLPENVGGAMYVKFTCDGLGSDMCFENPSIDSSYGAILSAIEHGKDVKVVVPFMDSFMYLPFTSKNETTDGGGFLTFNLIIVTASSTSIQMISVQIHPDGTCYGRIDKIQTA